MNTNQSSIQEAINPEKTIMGFSGSPRINGNSDTILNQIISGVARENIEADALNLTKLKFQGCIGCEKCRKDKICTGLTDDLSPVYDRIISSKGLVLVSPTHNYNITSWMKAFIDRLYCFYNFEDTRPRSWSSQFAGQGRKAVIASICEQESVEDMGFTLEAMKQPLAALGFDVIGELAVFKIFDKAKVKDDKEAMEKAYQLGRNLACAVK
ncbi:flavodoxin family protein [uncultured Desulfobacter sp.]|jgi:multimeric flavodoxin WrbA|uniref:flavodoxin family protein n=1 Tax=uncultured Desulfobacter sp. TaxID=240139 RepID=UPI0029C90215|nr:flavodoxin family protein [uncultured Desulfobacter sp.]